MLTATDPSTGQTLREVQPASSTEVERILVTADAAYQSWRQTTFDERARVLKDVAKLMRDDIENLAILMTEEMGKPIKEARGEVQKAAWCAEHYAEHAEAYLKTDTIESDATLSYVQYRPLGVILGILPWNAPFWLAFRYCAPTLMAGNTCVMKHDPHVPACAEAIGKLFERVGAPEGIFQNLPLETPDVERSFETIGFRPSPSPDRKRVGRLSPPSPPPKSSIPCSNLAVRTRPSCCPMPIWKKPRM